MSAPFLFAAAAASLPLPDASEAAQIIVTARRREEDLRDVPAAISVVTGDVLARSNAVNISQVAQLVPVLNYASPNPRNTAFTIRGLGSSVVAISQANDGLEPGVGFYVDQVYHARPAAAAFDFADIEQIEILRGPQGTVFGKNSTAGAIHITSKPPAFTFGGEEELSLGQNGFVQAKAAVTGPIFGKSLAFRIAGALTRRNGVIRNVQTGAEQNNLHNDALRAQLLFKPGPTFSLRIIGDWSNFKSECCTQLHVRVAPTLKPVAQQYAALAAGAIPGGYRPPSENPYDRLTDIDASLGVDTDQGGLSAIAELDTRAGTLTSVSAWRFWNWDAANDRDYTGLSIQTVQRIPSRQEQFSQELRLASTGGAKLDHVLGLYYFRQRIRGQPISIYGPLATYWLLSASALRTPALLDGYRTKGATDFMSTSYAAFAELNWRPWPRLSVTGGLRYTHEIKNGHYAVETSGGQATQPGTALFNDQQSILRSQSYAARNADGSLSGRANLSWRFNEALMAYAGFARGQKSGGINMSGLPVYPAGVPGQTSGAPILSTVTVRPERNTSWEAGFKTTLWNGAVRLDVAAFSVRVRDFQANVVDNAAVIALRSYLANIPLVTVKGIEFDASARIGSRFTLRAAGAHSDGIYARYPSAPCPIERTGSATAQCDLSGKGLAGLPHWSGSLGAEYVLPWRDLSVFVSADAHARTWISGEVTASAHTRIDGYAAVNASMGVRTASGWEVSLFARNLFNRNWLQNVTVQAGNSGLIVGTPSDPRNVAIVLRRRH